MYTGTFDYDIIIVGAGISGLTAAYAIHERDKNLSLLVLDGNDRIGGKTLSVALNVGRGQKLPFDIGGQFVCSSQTHLMNLLQKLDIRIEENNNDFGHTLLDYDGTVYTTESVPPVFGEIQEVHDIMQFLGKLESLCKRVSLESPLNMEDYNDLDSTTMEAYMYSHLTYPLTKQYIRILVKTICGAEPSDISVLFFLVYCHSAEGITNTYLRSKIGGKGCWIKNGSTEICEKIAREIGEDNIKTNSAVTSIARTDFYVLVRTAEHEYKCQYVVLALPPKQLLNVNFYPPLSDSKNTILKRMRYRSRLKFIVTYERQFWRERNYNGDIYTFNKRREMFPILVAYDISSYGNAALTGLLDVDYAKKKSYKTEVLAHLGIYFGEEALQPLDYIERLWSDDEHIFEGCAISLPPPRMMQHFHEIRRPIGRLFFAGAETATYWYGHIAGAVQAGFRAAIEVLYEIRPQAINAQDFIDLKPRRLLREFYAGEQELVQHDWLIIMFITTIISYVVLKVIAGLHYMMRLFAFRRQ